MFHLAYMGPLTEADCEHRVVALSAEGKRYSVKTPMTNTSDDEDHNIRMTMRYFRADLSNDEEVAYFGVEIKRK